MNGSQRQPSALAGWYDYRIWSLKARYLNMFIIF